MSEGRHPGDEEQLHPELGREKPGRFEKELQSALLILLRHMRAAKRTSKDWVEPLVDELHAALTRIMEEHGPIQLHVLADGFRRGPHKVLDYSPREDAAIFQLFQFGVRQLAFHPGLERDELHELMDVLATDLSQLENQEEDVTTLLLSKDFTAIEFVVIETFSEGADEEVTQGQRDRTGEIQTLVNQALANTLSDMGGGAPAGSIAFWKADVTFFKEANLPKLLQALPRIEVTAAGEEKEDPELAQLAEELKESMRLSTRWLSTATLTAMRGAKPNVAERLATILGGELLREVALHGLASVATATMEAMEWLEENGRDDLGRAVAERIFPEELRLLAARTLDQTDKAVLGERGERAAAVALAILAWLPSAQIPIALKMICRYTGSPIQAHGLAALMGTGEAFGPAATILPEIEAKPALAIVQSVRGTPLDPAVLTLFQAALGHPDLRVRVQALAWFAHHGGDHAVSVLGQALRDPAVEVRTASLALLGRAHEKIARALVKVWYESEFVDRLELAEKKVGALMVARLLDDHAIPFLRGEVDHKNLMKRQRVDDRRIAAVAGLGLLCDVESAELLEKLTTSRFASDELKQEALHVLKCFEEGAHSYPDPITELEARLAGLELTDFLDATQPVRPLLALSPELTQVHQAARDDAPTRMMRPADAVPTALVPAVEAAEEDIDAATELGPDPATTNDRALEFLFTDLGAKRPSIAGMAAVTPSPAAEVPSASSLPPEPAAPETPFGRSSSEGRRISRPIRYSATPSIPVRRDDLPPSAVVLPPAPAAPADDPTVASSADMDALRAAVDEIETATEMLAGEIASTAPPPPPAEEAPAFDDDDPLAHFSFDSLGPPVRRRGKGRKKDG